VRTYLAKANNKWDKMLRSEIDHVILLMGENVREEPVNSENIRLWFQAARRSENVTFEEAIERLSYWRANVDAIDATFYLYILYVLQVFDGSLMAVSKARELIDECKQKARGLRIRVNSVEWYGKGKDLRRVIHYKSLGEWHQVFESGERIVLIDGRIAEINGPASGYLELTSGLKAFFVPSRGYRNRNFTSRDLNNAIRCYLAFTYDGLRGWSVRDLEEDTSS